MNATKKYVVNQGGTSSGKTYAILQVLFIKAITEIGSVITVVGQDIPNLKRGAFRDSLNIINSFDLIKQYVAKINYSDRILTFRNNSIIEYASFQDVQDAASGKRDYSFFNEANGIDYMIFWQISIRTRKQNFLDYNPTAKFWVHEKLIDKDDCQLIISDHRHNPFLDEEMHREIEGIDDKELFEVYARGKTGKISGLIYPNWRTCKDMPDDYKARWVGIDFGFTNDPTAIIDVRLSDGQLWIDEICYQRKLLNTDIFQIIKDNDLLNLVVIADSAEPKSIAELQGLGARIVPAKKGNDSIKAGIDILKRYKLNVTNGSVNVKKELMSYMWKKDKATGEDTNEPVGFLDHAMDAIRYVALNNLVDRREAKPIRAGVGKLWQNAS